MSNKIEFDLWKIESFHALLATCLRVRKAELVQRMRQMSETLAARATDLESDADTWIKPMGEVCGEGYEIDRIAAEVKTLQHVKVELGWCLARKTGGRT